MLTIVSATSRLLGLPDRYLVSLRIWAVVGLVPSSRSIPRTRDAARHFCTSSREIIAEILDVEAPNEEVISSDPDCQVTERGTPTRRAKVQYCLDRKGLSNQHLEGFIETNIGDLTMLFRDLNAGAHGSAGKFTLDQLGMIKSRVEDSIEFIYEVVS